jgi:ribonuclease III
VAKSTPQEQLFDRLGLVFDAQLLELALTHRSFAYESGGLPTNERLEFLGDSVLGVVVTDELYHRYPDLPEGNLAKLRSAVVSARALAVQARRLGLGEFIRLGRGEETTGGRDKSSILADTFEAILGAVYLDLGIEVSRELILRLLDEQLAEAAELGAGLDWKTSLQELTAEFGIGVPTYAIEESGPDHAKRFEAQVVLAHKHYGHGTGSNKKEAEQQAAASAYAELRAERDIEEQRSTQDPHTGE